MKTTQPSSASSLTRRLPSVRRHAYLGGFAVALAGLFGGVIATNAATANFTNGGGDNAYTNPANWSTGTVPNTSAGDIAVIANGSPVTYTPGGDLVIANGGMLRVTNGTFAQVVGNNYYQLNGNGSIVVNGGTFNQGTASSNPFNVTGTGNAFTVSAGAVNINSNFNMNIGLTYSQSGGVVNVTGSETDFSSTTITLSGGTFNTKLITGVNGTGTTTFNISGGTLNLSGASFNGIYGGGTTQYINFTPGSNGRITFSSGSTTASDVQGFINNGVIEYDSGGTGTLSNFNIVTSGGVVTLSLVGATVPEPSTFAMLGIAGVGALAAIRRRRN